ncbi:PKS/NRPS-like protein biosynthetic cluster [Apiospora phragmitis]|uniref:PKS/NRPS-like protein biosynthetic cluster n=1 Tax=Apiospora phragmitis TaxID=2905665 RepID=A0ABR1X7K8_9PEZI
MPATELEGQILAVWTSVLGHDRIGLDDNFFEVGGDSVRVIRVQNELETLLGRRVLAPKLFEHYTIKTLAAWLRSSLETNSPIPVYPTRLPPETVEDIAIVSMALRLPGEITTPQGFWDLLERGGDAITDVPEGRWPDHENSTSEASLRGGFIRSIDAFDISFFGISPREARSLDPAQYMMLETCWEGLERAGYTMEQLRG